LPLDFSGRPTLLTLLNLFMQQSANQQYETRPLLVVIDAMA